MTTKTKEEGSKVALIKAEINRELGDAETLKSLLDTTFKGLDGANMKRAMLEGMLRGFSFEDFLKGDVYAIPFGGGYSLVTSVAHSRKVGMRSGVIGVSEPIYGMTEDGKNIEWCSVTVKRRVGQDIGEFTAKVYFKEYSTGKNLWASKPRTMIAKVAEQHAYRKACPEELAEVYVAEEMEREVTPTVALDLSKYEDELRGTKTEEELQRVWADMPMDAKMAPSMTKALGEMKAIIADAGKDID